MRWTVWVVATGCVGSVSVEGAVQLDVSQIGTTLHIEVPAAAAADVLVGLDGVELFSAAVPAVDDLLSFDVPFSPCDLFGTTAALVVTVDGAVVAEDLDIAGTVERDGAGVVSAEPFALCGPGPYYVETAIGGNLLVTTDGAGIQVLDHLADRGVASSGSQLEFAVPAGAWDVESDGASWVAFLIR